MTALDYSLRQRITAHAAGDRSISGLRVHDTEHDDDDPRYMRVYTVPTKDGDPIRADEYHVDALNETVFEANRDHYSHAPDRYNPGAPVVLVVYESDLDKRVGDGWRDAAKRRDLRAFIESFRAEWGVTVRRYAFPIDRLAMTEGDE